MEFTERHYHLAELAYDAYCKQTGGKSLVTGDSLPTFAVLRQPIKDAWAAAAIAVSPAEPTLEDRVKDIERREKGGGK